MTNLQYEIRVLLKIYWRATIHYCTWYDFLRNRRYALVPFPICHNFFRVSIFIFISVLETFGLDLVPKGPSPKVRTTFKTKHYSKIGKLIYISVLDKHIGTSKVVIFKLRGRLFLLVVHLMSLAHTIF